MTAVLFKAMRDLRRRLLQATVIFVTTLFAVGTGAMALMLISQPSDPYKAAFDAQKGAHLQVGFDSRIDPGTLAQTPSLIGATAYGGPYRMPTSTTSLSGTSSRSSAFRPRPSSPSWPWWWTSTKSAPTSAAGVRGSLVRRSHP